MRIRTIALKGFYGKEAQTVLGADSCSNLFSNYQDTYPQTSEHRNIFNHLSLRKESKLEYGSKNVINYLLMIMY